MLMSSSISPSTNSNDDNFVAQIDETENNRLKLLLFEQNLMVDTYINDVFFIMARGLVLERLFFNHLHLYSDPRTTWLVINTTPEDEHFFLQKLKAHNPDCPPKLITADVLSKDREVVYRSGGVQFVTSRILMVDLLTDRLPYNKLGGILVYRAHELLSGFQESFILRLFREKKKNGLIKAFTDNPLHIVADGALGQLQRLLNLLYVRQVVIVPRFHAEVKACFEANTPKLTQMSIQLEPAQRKAQASLRDIIATCIRELKQCTKDFDTESESDALTPSATLRPTRLEISLKKRDVPLTERQQRLINDLHTLRALFHKIEDLDPTNAMTFIAYLRTNKEVLENNSGWLFTQSAAALFSNIDALCSVKDEEGNRTIAAPAKWPIFCAILEEIAAKLAKENNSVLVLVSDEQLARQLIDLVKFGRRRYIWMLARKVVEPSRRDNLASAPPIVPMWNPTNVAYYDAQLFEKDSQELRANLRIAQKEEAKRMRKRCKMREAAMDPKQARLDRFGIQPFAKAQTAKMGEGEEEGAGGRRRKGGSGKVIAFACRRRRRSPFAIRLPLGGQKMASEAEGEGMLPEDPLIEFYDEEEEEESQGKSDGIEMMKNGDDAEEKGRREEEGEESILALDHSPPPPPTPEKEQQSERSLPPLNRSIAGAARERAERSIRIIDEFHRTQLEEEEDGLLLEEDPEDASVAATDLLPPTFPQSISSTLVFLGLGNRYRLIKCLDALRPKHVIMYSQDIAATRMIEAFKALNEDHPLDLHVLMYEESSEEERYLSSIQRELEAIETLIKEQGLLMVPREFDVARDNVSQLRRLTMPAQGRVDSRRPVFSAAQMLEEEEAEMRSIVIVDMREFNSELPTVLYRRGVDLQAATLEVGDYILSPDICCERKSLDDLAQSLVNGRLFKQVEQMTKHYKRSILLIESTEKYRNRVVRIGAFQGELSRRGREVRALLALLTRNFPQLNILWSVSPAHSAELFEELKLDQPNPSLEAALKKKRARLENNNKGGELDP